MEIKKIRIVSLKVFKIMESLFQIWKDFEKGPICKF